MSNRYYSGPVSDHFNGKRFFVPGASSTDKTLADLWKWHRQGTRSQWPSVVPAVSGVRPETRTEALSVTHIGHASVLLQWHRYNILVDPVWSDRASPVRWLGPRRYNAPGVSFADLPPIDAILLTHNHYDHMDVRTLRKLVKQHRPVVLTLLGNDGLLRNSIAGVCVRAGDWWSEHALLPELDATIVPAYHWSSRSAFDRRMALWGGFVLRAAGTTIYCAGDTGLDDGSIFKEIATRFPNIDLALLPIGAYAPRWFMRAQHANPNDALEITAILNARAALGIHWGTFHLTDEPWGEPAQLFSNGIEQRGWNRYRFLPLQAGDVWCARNAASRGNDRPVQSVER